MQVYKGDETELKFSNAAATITEGLTLELDRFFEDAFIAFPLGDVIWESGRSPLANAIPQAVFREAYPEIFESFLEAGSFEGYLAVFRKIFGDTVAVTFTVPGPGKLQIDIVAAGVVLNNMIARTVVGNTYSLDEVIDDEGDNIALRTIKGMESEYEVMQMLFELVPDGIYTEITLTIGS